MSAGQRWTLVLMVVVIGIAAAFALWPLPAQTFQGEHATCDAGSGSQSALYVWAFPDSVVTGQQQTAAPQTAQAFVDFCKGIATTRLKQVAIAIVAALLIGTLVLVILGASEPRRGSPPERHSVAP